MKIEINYKHCTDLVEQNYPGELPEQMPIFLWCDWQKGIIYTDTRNYNISGTTFYEFHGHENSFRLPYEVNAVELKEYVEENILPIANKIESAYEEVWNGSNNVARFGKLENETKTGYSKLVVLMDKIVDLCNEAPCHNWQWWDAYEWLEDNPDFNGAIHKDMDEDEMIEVEKQIKDEAFSNNAIVNNVYEYIENRVDELNDEDID